MLNKFIGMLSIFLFTLKRLVCKQNLRICVSALLPQLMNNFIQLHMVASV